MTFTNSYMVLFDSKRVEDKIAEKQKSSEEKRNEVSISPHSPLICLLTRTSCCDSAPSFNPSKPTHHLRCSMWRNIFILEILNQCYTNSIPQAYSLFFNKYIKGRFQKKSKICFCLPYPFDLK